jgi:hypothetical protein
VILEIGLCNEGAVLQLMVEIFGVHLNCQLEIMVYDGKPSLD